MKILNAVIHNVVAYIVVATIVLTSITMFAVAADSEKLYGDINASNSVNASDALIALQYAAKLLSLNEEQEILADVSGDKKINASDALLILQYAAKLINEFPVGTIVKATESSKPEITELVPTSSTDIEYTPTPSSDVDVTSTPTTDVEDTPTPSADVDITPTPTTDIEVHPTPTPEVEETPVPTIDTSPQIVVNSVNVSPGDKNVQVEVCVKNNPGILGMTLTIDYDDTVMKLKDAVNGAAVSNKLTFTTAKQLKDGCNFVWDGQEIFKEDILDGVIMTLTFDILDSASAGTYDIDFSYEDGDIIDGDLIPVSINIKAGTIVIK